MLSQVDENGEIIENHQDVGINIAIKGEDFKNSESLENGEDSYGNASKRKKNLSKDGRYYLYLSNFSI